MLQQKISKALKEIDSKVSLLTGKVLLGLSGGKDSLVCYDLCKEVLGSERIIPFHMEFIPDLRITKELLDYPTKRFGIKKIWYYPSEAMLLPFKDGFYNFENSKISEIPNIRRKDIVMLACQEHKVNQVVMGVKSNDNIRIRQQVEKNQYFGGGIYPIYNWSTKDVLTYLKSRDIEVPKQFYEGFRGVDLGDYSVLYMQKHYPDDLDKIEAYFPFVRAIVKKYEYYNLKVAVKRV